MVLRRVGDQKNDDHEYAEIVDEAVEATEILDEGGQEASSQGVWVFNLNRRWTISVLTMTKFYASWHMLCNQWDISNIVIGAEGGHTNTNGNVTKVIETECMICSEPNHLVTFIPCNCQVWAEKTMSDGTKKNNTKYQIKTITEGWVHIMCYLATLVGSVNGVLKQRGKIL